MTALAETVTSDEQLVRDRLDALLRDHDPKTTNATEFLGAQFDAGLAWVHFPEGFGGLGVAPGLQAVADGILQGAGGPNPFWLNPMGYGMAGPTVMAHASRELAAELLRADYVCDDIWCQLFSE